MMGDDPDTARDYASQNGIIATHCGVEFSPLNPDPSTVLIEDIAHALANSCRFTGHVDRFYSVAQHSVHVSELVESKDPELAFTALLHDASEAYLSDISRPIKMQPEFGDVYKKFEHRLEVAIAERFGLVFPYPDIIKWADNVMLRSEQRDLMPNLLRFAGDEYLPFTIQPWSPVVAKAHFMDRFDLLWSRREAA
jgi:hypothetical protein